MFKHLILYAVRQFLLNLCLPLLVYNSTRARIVWFISALHPQHLDRAWNLQKEGKQAGEEEDGSRLAESGCQPGLSPPKAQALFQHRGTEGKKG